MPLKIVQRHGSPYWYLRGSVKGIRVDESTGVSDKQAAEDIRITREAELLKRAIHGDCVTRTFDEAALSYMEAGGERGHLAPILKLIGGKVLAQIDQALIEDTAARIYKKNPVGPATLNRTVYTPISAVLHHAARLKWCPKPVIARPKQPEGRVRCVTREEAQRLIAAASDHMKPLVLFLFSTGCRLAEALYLNWDHIDLSRCEVTFSQTKNGKPRVVPLSPEIVAALANLPYNSGPVFRVPRKGPEPKPGKPDNRPIGKGYAARGGVGGGQIKTAWAGMCRRAKISNFTPHDCRHTFATWYIRANPKNTLGLMKICGWESADMVKRYAHLDIEDVREGVDDIWGKGGKAQKPKTRKAKPDNVIALGK